MVQKWKILYVSKQFKKLSNVSIIKINSIYEKELLELDIRNK